MARSNHYIDPDFQACYAKAIARAWTDTDYKAKLLNDSRAALAEMGIDLPDGTTVSVSESTSEHLNLVLPPAPEGEISDEALQTAHGGYCSISCCW